MLHPILPQHDIPHLPKMNSQTSIQSASQPQPQPPPPPSQAPPRPPSKNMWDIESQVDKEVKIKKSDPNLPFLTSFSSNPVSNDLLINLYFIEISLPLSSSSFSISLPLSKVK